MPRCDVKRAMEHGRQRAAAKIQTHPRSTASLEHALTFVGNKIAQESVDVNSRDLLVVDAVPNAASRAL
jgi:hypothetical protein